MSHDHTDPRAIRSYVTDYTDVLEAEQERIGRPPARGLAISGGGIRSASFGLGVLQALVRGRVLETIDYLSTVSGGGYIGSSLTWFLEHNLPTGIDKQTGEVTTVPAGTTPADFPFGKPRTGARLRKPSVFGEVSERDPDGGSDADEPETANLVLDFIRQRAQYLTPGRGLNMIALFGTAVRSMFVSLVAYLAMITAVLLLLLLPVWPRLGLPIDVLPPIGPVSTVDYLIPAALVIVALLAASGIGFSFYTRLSRAQLAAQYKWSLRDQRIIGFLWTVVVIFALIGSLPHAASYLGERLGSLTTGAIATLLGSVLGFLEFRKEANRGTSERGRMDRVISNLRIWVGSAAVIYGLLLLAFVAAGALEEIALTHWWVIPVVLAGALILAVVTNLNYSGLHRMYRDRLMETFLPDAQSVVENRWGMARLADTKRLEEFCVDGPTARPYHLINSNVVLIDSPTSKYRGRGGDSFLLSPLYCGSDATGWRRTGEFLKSRGFRGVTLATVMAISGAAVNPNTGAAGGGATRNRFVSALFSLLNLRLGYWAPSPRLDAPLPFTPNYLVPGVESALGKGHTERTWRGKKSRRIELTDGGHFDNLGLYELIRRKLELIIVSDAGADPNFKFGALASVVERVRVDFGATIRFWDGPMASSVDESGSDPAVGSVDDNADHEEEKRKKVRRDLTGLIPKPVSGMPNDYPRFADRGYAVADVEYADGKGGVLVYLKTTLTEDLPADIYGYRSANPAFPDQSTADQFFDEAQFEAYRELGYQLTKSMLKEEPGEEVFGGRWDKSG